MTDLEQLFQERRARLTAERMLAMRDAELSSATQNFSSRAQKLCEEVDETRAEISSVIHENKKVRSDLDDATAKIKVLSGDYGTVLIRYVMVLLFLMLIAEWFLPTRPISQFLMD